MEAAELRYRAYGEDRYSWGETPTDYRFTGQAEHSSIGLYYYNARWYDASLGRFAQADTIVPDPANSQSWNRYSYVENDPIRFVDPIGHYLCSVFGGPSGGTSCDQWVNDALDVLGRYGGQEGRDLVTTFDELDGPLDVGVNIIFLPFQEYGVPVAGIARPISSFVSDLLLGSDALALDPTNPGNWGNVATLAHEIVHLGQGATRRLSIQGEAQAYQIEGKIRVELDKAAQALAGVTVKQTAYTAGVANLDLSTRAGVEQARVVFGQSSLNIYTWQPLFPLEKETAYKIALAGYRITHRATQAAKGISGGVVDIGKALWRRAFGP